MRLRALTLALSLLGLACVMTGTPARAQSETRAAPADAAIEAAKLVADSIYMEGPTIIVAEGNVEVFYARTHLRAARVRFDDMTNQLEIAGPITLTEGENVIVAADSANLSVDLRDGIMRGARLVLNQQLQIAAAEMTRVGGRYTQLYKIVASSCHVCEKHPTPLWEIRAKRLVHDQQERQLYFDQAHVRVMGMPIFYAPRLRLPDPTLKRATGFLIPSVRSTSRLGFGVKIPYFIRLGDHRDLTVTPYLSSSTQTLELRYRQAFRNGDIEFNGAVSRDDLRPDNTRSYLFGTGQFDLRRDYKLAFDIEVASDDAYLLDYGYSDKDRLDSAIALTRTSRDKYFGAELIHYQTLRASESNTTIPSVVGNIVQHRRFQPGLVGGNADLIFEAHSHYRRSGMAGDDGRDVARATARLDWRRDWTLDKGMIAGLMTQTRADFYATRQGNPTDADGVFGAATVGTELRWPMQRTGADGASHLLEPVVQLLWSDDNRDGIANEDSTLLEFDEGNLYDLSRFAGADRLERGFRLNAGLTWTRYDPAGWSMGLTLGRIVRSRDHGQFTAGSGLTGTTSDWLAAVQVELPNNLTLMNRALFDDKLEFTRNETRIAWRNDKVELASSYLWMDAAPAENRPQLSEWSLDSNFAIGRGWRAKADWRYDFIANRAARAGIGLEFETECVKVDLSLSRRFTSSTSVSPTTDFGLSVSLTGFGGGRTGRNYVNRCAG